MVTKNFQTKKLDPSQVNCFGCVAKARPSPQFLSGSRVRLALTAAVEEET